jgi:hypothetical protein
MENKTIKEKIDRQKDFHKTLGEIYNMDINHKEVLWDDSQITVLLKQNDSLYRHVAIKECEIGSLYELDENDIQNEVGWIVVKQII